MASWELVSAWRNRDECVIAIGVGYRTKKTKWQCCLEIATETCNTRQIGRKSRAQATLQPASLPGPGGRGLCHRPRSHRRHHGLRAGARPSVTHPAFVCHRSEEHT